MKTAAFAVAAGSLLSSAIASPHDNHMAFHQRRAWDLSPRGEESCGCTTYTTTIYGSPTLGQPSYPHPTVTNTATVTPYPVQSHSSPTYESHSTVETYSTPKSHSSVETQTSYVSVTPIPAPTPYVTTCPTPGTYTVPASTTTITGTLTVPYPTHTVCAPGACTYGGVTTSVTTSTVVTCPYAHVTTSGTNVYSTVTQTTYTCPTSGTYTIGGSTTTVTGTITVPYPTPTTYHPGTYTIPETTVTITKTNEVFTCPYSSYTPAPKPTEYTTAPKPSPYTPSPKPSPYTPPPQPESEHPHPPPQSTYAPPPSTPTPVPHKPHYPHPKTHPKPVINGNKYAITYTPYTSTGECKSAGDVMSDMAVVKANGFTTVRLYSTDCSTLPNVGNACSAHGLRMILGIFIDESGISGAHEQLQDIVQWGTYDLVDMVIAGNEAVFNGYCTASELAGFVSQVKSTLSGAGCNVPVTTTEPLNILQEYGSALCDVVDVMGGNFQPFFNTETTASDAGQFVQSQMELAKKVCPGLDVYNFECGWPHAGSPNGAAVPGVAQQQEAINGIINLVGDHTAIFSFQDDAWKTGGLDVEKYFGTQDCFAE